MAKKNQLTKADYLSIGELKKLLERLHLNREYLWELYVRVSFCTALRASDVLSLTWADVLNRSALVKTEKKTGKTRRIALNDKTRESIAKLYVLLKSPNPAELMFANPRTHLAYSIQYINSNLKEWKEKWHINIGNFSTHTFRKTFGRYVYDMNDNKSEALVLLNSIFKHSSIDITKVYIGLRDEEINSVFSSIKI